MSSDFIGIEEDEAAAVVEDADDEAELGGGGVVRRVSRRAACSLANSLTLGGKCTATIAKCATRPTRNGSTSLALEDADVAVEDTSYFFK